MADDDEVLDPSETEDQEVAQHLRYSISSYGADYPVDALIKRVDSGDIKVPDFQRKYVWSRTQASRFIESLLLGLPVPAVFLAKDVDKKLLVVDGQQRLLTLSFFFREKWPTTPDVDFAHAPYVPFKLVGVGERYNGKTFTGLSPEDRRHLDDQVIHAIIVKQEDPPGQMTGIYQVFERLNTGGTRLYPQEIRTAIYPGTFNVLLAQLNAHASWRAIYGKESKRMKDRELILRFFALQEGLADYARPMEEALNKYMEKKQHIPPLEAASKAELFQKTVDFAFGALGSQAFRPEKVLNAAFFDAVAIGLAARLAAGNPPAPGAWAAAYATLANSPAFKSAYLRSTADDEQVKTRIRLATEAFRSV